METEQLNLKINSKLMEDASIYAKNFGYNNVQELLRESLREKLYQNELNPEYVREFLNDSEFNDGIGIEESKKLFEIKKKRF